MFNTLFLVSFSPTEYQSGLLYQNLSTHPPPTSHLQRICWFTEYTWNDTKKESLSLAAWCLDFWALPCFEMTLWFVGFDTVNIICVICVNQIYQIYHTTHTVVYISPLYLHLPIENNLIMLTECFTLNSKSTSPYKKGRTKRTSVASFLLLASVFLSYPTYTAFLPFIIISYMLWWDYRLNSIIPQTSHDSICHGTTGP